MEHPSEVSPNRIAHDYQVSADEFTGAAQVSVSLDLPVSRHGFGPALSLSWGSARRQGVFGRGWALSGIPAIGLDTEAGLPRYDGTDGFTSSIAGSLVFERDAAGEIVRRNAGGFRVEVLRPRGEGPRIRFERWMDLATGEFHWRSRDTVNTYTIYGRSGANRIADPAAPRRIYQWLPEVTVSARGDAVVYDYVEEDLSGGAGRRLADAPRRTALAQRYPKRLRWGNHAPVEDAAALDPETVTWSFTAVFDYGDHADDAPAVLPDRDRPVRRDPFSSGAPGFDLRTWRLCRRLLIFHGFDALGAEPVLTRAATLGYDERPDGARLVTLTRTGYRGVGAGRQGRSAPALSFDYTEPGVGTAFTSVARPLEATAQAGHASVKTLLVDLYGEGLPGLLQDDRSGWFFQRNLGGGRFARPVCVQARPVHSVTSVSLGDFDGDGNMDAAVLAGQGAGHYRFDRETGAWTAFRPFRKMPVLDGRAGVERLDLTGDGRADLVVRMKDGLRIHESEGTDGFAQEARDVRLASTADGPAGQPPLGSDSATDYLFADMTGDGLPDQVLIRSGLVAYWPNLGRGRFGGPVIMENAPVLETGGRFAIDRVLLADLDGSGTADLIHMGEGELSIWTNAAGNGFTARRVLPNLPMIDRSGVLDVLDVSGDGGISLVWTEKRKGRIAAYQALPLSSPVPPGMIRAVSNGMGRVDRLDYGYSATHYLRDQSTPRAWTTRLPVHVVTVDRIVTEDLIGGAVQESTYSYRNGAYSSRKRRFAGFGEVDTQQAHFVQSTGDPLPVSQPLLLRRFFAQGEGLVRRDRYWRDDPDAVPVPAYDLDTSALASVIDAETAVEARAALHGRPLREERYAVTAEGPAPVPLSVAETGYVVRVEQAAVPRGRDGRARRPSDRAIIACTERETLRAHYEGDAADPRVQHAFVLARDLQGAVTLSAQVSYPRRPGMPVEDEGQARLGCAVERLDLRHHVSDDRHALNLPVAEESFAIPGLALPARGYFTFGEAHAAILVALAAPRDFHQALRTGWSRTFYCNAAGDGALPFGDAAHPARVHHVETAAFSDDFATAQYGAGIAARLPGLGYTLDAGHWWRRSVTQTYLGAEGFFLPSGHVLADGRRIEIAYDSSFHFAVRVTDPFGAVAVSEQDYAALATRRSLSPTGAWSETVFDPLGLPVRTSSGGTVVDDGNAERSYGFEALGAAPVPDMAAALADPGVVLGASVRLVVYDFDAFARDGTPPVALDIRAQDLKHDGAGGSQRGTNQPLVALTYYDGFGDTIAEKRQVEPGEAISRDGGGAVVLDGGGAPLLSQTASRWLASGWVRRNAKGEAITLFDPYFSDRPDFEDDEVLMTFGRPTRVFHDAAGRILETQLPDGAVERNVFAAWGKQGFDANDTVAHSAWRLSRVILPVAHPERHALDVTLPHADTPDRHVFDSEGREVRVLQTDGAGGTREQRVRYLASGDVDRTIDGRGIETSRTLRDMAGRIVSQWFADAGETRTLFDARDNPVEVTDATGRVRLSSFDALDRLVSVEIDTESGPRRIHEVGYADDPADTETLRRNLLGLAVRTRDEAGEHVVLDARPDGEVTRSRMNLVADPEAAVDWSGAVQLEGDVFTQAIDHDALGRPLREHRADGSVVAAHYTQSGGLSRLSVRTADGQVAETEILGQAGYSAHGQRETARLGNGVRITRTYDPDTLLVRRILAERSAAGGRPPLLQDFRYTYDPVGNITATEDLAHRGGARSVFDGIAGVSADRRYAYDAYYRLVRCEGRAHQAFTNGPGILPVLPLSDGGGTERFAQTYAYDGSDNLTRLRHMGGASNFTVDFWIDPGSNRSRPLLGPGGIAAANPAADFDAGGEMRRIDHLARLEWRHDQRLTRAVVVDRSGDGRPDDDELYLYDAQGTRLRKITRRLMADGAVERIEVTYLGGAERRRIFRGTTMILERFMTRLSDGFSDVAELHRWTRDTTARETDDPTGTRLCYVLTDHLGSAMLRLDEAARVISYEELIPYGQTAFAAADDARETALKAYGFIGRERDAATGFHHIGQRYYSSWLCRWISPDPAGDADGPNQYLYAGANPITNLDPTGLQTTTRRRPGRRIPSDGNATADRRIDAALANESAAVQVGYMMGTVTAYVDPEGTVHFGSRSEMLARSEADRRSGADILDINGGGNGTGTGTGGNGALGTSAADPEAGGGTTDGDTPDPPPDPGGSTGSAQEDGTGTGIAETTTGNGEDGRREDDATDPGESEIGAEEGSEEGRGAVLDSERTGNGGGGDSDDPNALGQGDTGTGLGGGDGDPRRAGTGRAESPAHRPGGTGQGTGTEPGGVPGGQDEGTGQGEGTNPDAGGTPGGTGSEPGGAPGGAEGGALGGVAGAHEGGEGTESAPDGTEPSGNPGDGAPGDGGSRSAPEGNRDTEGAGRSSSGSARGSSNGARPPEQGDANGEGGGGQQEATVMDHVVRAAGYWHLEFGSDEPGESGGIPGGMGSLNLGSWGQAAFVALTVVDMVLTVASFGSLAALKVSLKVGLKAVQSFGRRALARIGAGLAATFSRQGAFRALQGVFRFRNFLFNRGRALRSFVGDTGLWASRLSPGQREIGDAILRDASNAIVMPVQVLRELGQAGRIRTRLAQYYRILTSRASIELVPDRLGAMLTRGKFGLGDNLIASEAAARALPLVTANVKMAQQIASYPPLRQLFGRVNILGINDQIRSAADLANLVF